MHLNDPITFCNLTTAELGLLRKGDFHTVADLLLVSTQDAGKRCKAPPLEVKRIIEKVLNSVPLFKLEPLDTLSDEEVFSTGDTLLDKALGGGIRTGMIWEVVGESAAGKTQLALQLSLYVQAPPTSGGLAGASCYLTTSSTLPTTRLLQIAEHNDLVSLGCGLADVHTIAAPTVTVLQRVLTETLPGFIENQASAGKRHIKLLVIDALGELFHSATRTTTSSLVERSKDIASISASLHAIATKYHLAILVLNEVIDVFNRSQVSSSSNEDQRDMFYSQQSRWFNTAEFFGDGAKEAALGLTWANQVNTRIMLSRTGRRRYLDSDDHAKRRHLPPSNANAMPIQTDKGADQTEPTLIRRFSIVFSSVASPVSLDYVVTESGISVVNEDVPQNMGPVNQPANLGFGPPHNTTGETNAETSAILHDGDEFDQLWEQAEYQNIDWDILEMTLSQKIQ